MKHSSHQHQHQQKVERIDSSSLTLFAESCIQSANDIVGKIKQGSEKKENANVVEYSNDLLGYIPKAIDDLLHSGRIKHLGDELKDQLHHIKVLSSSIHHDITEAIHHHRKCSDLERQIHLLSELIHLSKAILPGSKHHADSDAHHRPYRRDAVRRK